MPVPASSPAQTVDIAVNDVPRSVAIDTPLLGLLTEMGLAARPGLAVAVNASVVPRADWPTRALRHGDRVLIIHASQGG